MNDILARSRAPLSLLLAVTFAASPALSWYAYADDALEVVLDDLSLVSVGGDSHSLDIDSGRIEETSGFGTGASNSDLQNFGADSRESGSLVSYSADISIADYLDDIVYLLGEIADYHRQAGSGVSPLANIDSIFDKLVNIDTDLGSYFGVTAGHSSASNRKNFTFNGYSWSTGGYTVAWLLSHIWVYIGSVASYTASVASNTTHIDSIYSLLQKQWGYGYGGTAVIQDGSPIDVLKNLYSDNRTFLLLQYWNGDLGQGAGTRNYSASELLGLIGRSQYQTQMKSDTLIALVNDLLDQGIAGSSFLSKGFNDILTKLDDLHFSFDGDISVDMSGVESRLDDIKNLLLAAGVVENSKDILDAILGDFDNLASAALMGEVQAAAQSAFPFCIPAVVKQVFGLVEADPAPPVFDFEIGGQQMHVDCAPMQGFADVLGWACRLTLVFVCVVSSRRFIYTGVASS